MAIPWRDAVIAALQRFAARHESRIVVRSVLITEELARIVRETESTGSTPDKTLNRILQELRDAGQVEFLDPGRYLLLNHPINVEDAELPDDAIDLAIPRRSLQLGVVATASDECVQRRRRGQQRLRELSLLDYHTHCAVCDVYDSALLIASHIVRWADAPEHRGKLSNVLCLCRFHDVLFECGYWALSNDFTILKRPEVASRTVNMILDAMTRFEPPETHLPSPEFLAQHRRRVGFERT